MRTQPTDHVAVIGAGLAGLSAAATAARVGRLVTVLDARSPGGRARTVRREGFLLNEGPHALYRGGEGAKVLARLGVKHSGHSPSLRGSRGHSKGELVPLPLSPAGIAANGRTGAEVLRLLSRLAAARTTNWQGRSTRDWIDAMELRPQAVSLAEALVRVTTYVADFDRMPADLAIAQMRIGLFKGVSYLDGGWRTLVEGLAGAARSAGAELRSGVAAVAIGGEPGAWEVVTDTGEQIRATAVVLAVGGPDATRRLLPVEPGWGELGPAVTASCLDLGLRRPGPRFVLGIDEPLYLSPHCPPGNLAPPGGSLVHVMRYGATDARQDRAQLRQLARLAGLRDQDVVTERFLARMVVTHVLPPPEAGLRGRPPVSVSEGLFLAGDWIGPVGWLADAALASGERAGTMAAEVVTSISERSRVA